MHYNADAQAEFLEILGQTREYLQQQLRSGQRTVELAPGTWDSLCAAADRPLPAAASTAAPEHTTASPAPPLSPQPDVAGLFGDGALVRFDTLPALASYTVNCTKCGLCEGRTQVVFGVGNPQAKLVFVGEAPGRDEDLQGEPFVGRSGQLLTRIIESMFEPWTRKDVYICNVVKCRPPDNRDPRPDEIEACEPYLLRQLELMNPAVIVGLGKFAVQTLLRDKTGVMRLRGKWREYHGVPFMPALHPAYVLRNPKEGRRLMFEDMKLIRTRLEEQGVL